MTDKEFQKLNRSQLIDIIYELQLKQEELTAENKKLSEELADKRIRMSKAGNIAEAALEIHNVLQSAQDAAMHYLQEVQSRIDEEYIKIINKAKEEADDIIAKAHKEANEMVRQTESDSFRNSTEFKYRR